MLRPFIFSCFASIAIGTLAFQPTMAETNLPTSCGIALDIAKESSKTEKLKMRAKDFSAKYLCGLESSRAAFDLKKCREKIVSTLRTEIATQGGAAIAGSLLNEIKAKAPDLYASLRKSAGTDAKAISRLVTNHFFSNRRIEVILTSHESESYTLSGDFKFISIRHRFRLIDKFSSKGLAISETPEESRYYRMVKIEGQIFYESLFVDGFKLGNPLHYEEALRFVDASEAVLVGDLAVLGSAGGQLFLSKTANSEIRIRALMVIRKKLTPVLVLQFLRGNLPDGKIEDAKLVHQEFVPTDETVFRDLRLNLSTELQRALGIAHFRQALLRTECISSRNKR